MFQCLAERREEEKRYELETRGVEKKSPACSRPNEEKSGNKATVNKRETA